MAPAPMPGATSPRCRTPASRPTPPAIDRFWLFRTPLCRRSGFVLLASLASLTQLFMIRGYRAGGASALAPFEYARLPFAMMHGFLLFR